MSLPMQVEHDLHVSAPGWSSGSHDGPRVAEPMLSADSIDASAPGEAAEPYGEPVEGEREDFVPEHRRDLNTEAASLRHILLEGAKNPHCRVCNDSVAQRVPNRRRRHVEAFENFGVMPTMNHANADTLIHNGLSQERELLIVSWQWGTWVPFQSDPSARTAWSLCSFTSWVMMLQMRFILTALPSSSMLCGTVGALPARDGRSWHSSDE